MRLRFGFFHSLSTRHVRHGGRESTVPHLLALVLLLSTFAKAQDTQFFFDPNGNLFVQVGTTTTPPQIIGQPQNQLIVPGDSGAFSVVVLDTRALSYQWRFTGTNLMGATNDAVILQNVGTNSEGEYRVVLTNPSGSVTSAPAMLWIDNDADGLPDSWELTYFTNLNRTATADFDGDGVSNHQEFRDGTNPTNSASASFRLTVLRDGGSVAILPDQPAYTNGQVVTLTASASSNETFRAWLGDIVTRTNPITLVMTNNKTVSARFAPIVFTWTNFAGGDWNITTNWTPNLVPGSYDSVVISGLSLGGPGAFTVTLDTPADCASVVLDTGLQRTPTLTGSGTLTVREQMLWRGGTMSGPGKTILESGATLTLDMGDGLTLNTRTLELGGETFWTAGGNLILNNAVVTNRPSAVFYTLAAGSINWAGGAPRFDNAGTFRRTAAGGITTIRANVSFNNSGLVEIETGTLQLAGGGSANSAFNTLAGAVVEWTGGTYALNPGAQLNGSGLYQLNVGSVTADATLTVENLNLISGGSTLGGTGAVTIAGAMNWPAGVMSGTGRTIIAPGATLHAAIPSQVNLVTRTLENAGTVIWTNGTIALNGSSITNRAGALFHALGPGLMGNLGGSPRFDNAGTFRKSTSTGNLSLAGGVSFTNYGTVDIRNGIVAANGNFAFTSNSLLSCAIGGTNAGTGYGQLQKSGSIALNGTLSVDLVNGFVPAVNDSFTILTAGTRTGTFGNFHYPPNEVSMQLSNTANSVIVRVTDVFTTIPQPTLLPPEILGSDFKLTWTAVSNTVYRVEFNSDLTVSNWMALPGDVLGQSNTASKLDSLTTSNRHYRVRILP